MVHSGAAAAIADRGEELVRHVPALHAVSAFPMKHSAILIIDQWQLPLMSTLSQPFNSHVLGCTGLVLSLLSSVLADSSCASYNMGLIN